MLSFEEYAKARRSGQSRDEIAEKHFGVSPGKYGKRRQGGANGELAPSVSGFQQIPNADLSDPGRIEEIPDHDPNEPLAVEKQPYYTGKRTGRGREQPSVELPSFEEYAKARRRGKSREELEELYRQEPRKKFSEQTGRIRTEPKSGAGELTEEERAQLGEAFGPLADAVGEMTREAAAGAVKRETGTGDAGRNFQQAQEELNELDDQIARLEKLARRWEDKANGQARARQVREQLDELKTRREEAQKRYDAAENDYGMTVLLPEYQAGEGAWKGVHAAGTSGEDWYQSAKKQSEELYGQIRALEQQKEDAAGWATDELGAAWYEAYAAKLDEQIAALEEPYREAQRTLGWADRYRYSDLPEAEDFSTKAAEGLSAAEEARAQSEKERSDYMSGAGLFAFGDTAAGATELGRAVAAERFDISYELPMEEWTEEERNTFGYLYATDRERAKEYAVDLNNRRAKQKADEELRERTQGLVGDEWIGARGAGLLSGADYLQRAIEYGVHGYAKQPDYVTMTAYANGIDSAIAENLNRKYGTADLGVLGEKGIGDVYQLGMSVIDSAVAMAAGDEYGSLAIFFGKAASSGYDEAMQRGASAGQALAVGFAQGCAEALFEKFSVEKILDIAKQGTMRTVLKEILEAGAVEGSEELATSIANIFTDEIIADFSGGLSESDSAIRELMAQGASFDEARAAVVKSKLGELAWDTVGGMLSGGAHAVGASGIGQIRSETTRYEGETDRMLSVAEEAGTDQKLLDKLRQKAATGKLSVADVERLTRATQKQMDSEDSRSRRETAEAQLKERGLTQKDAAELAAVIVKSQDGERITSRERKLFEGSRTAQAVAMEMSEFGMRQGQERSVTLGQRQTSSREAMERMLAAGELPGTERGRPSGAWESGQKLTPKTGFERAGGAPLRAQIAARGEDRSAWARNIQQYADGTRRTATQEKIASGQQTARDLTPEVETARGAGKIVNVNPATGKVAVRLADGTSAVMTADEAGFTGAARTLFDSLRELGDSAAEAYASYDGSLDIDSYAAAWKAAEGLGEMGLKPESVDKLRATNVLTKEQRDKAFQMGQQKRETSIPQSAAPTAPFRQGGQERAAEGVGPYEGERARTQENQTQAQRSGLRLERTSSEANELSSQPRKRGDAELARTRGSVSFEGGTVGGKTYRAVSESRAQNLNKRQEAAVNAAYALAEVTGLDFVFFEGESGKDAQGIYKEGGTIYLNINAGRHLGKDLIAFTMSHELTHFIQDYAPEQYDALRQFIAEKLMDEGQFDALVTARRKAEPNLSYTEAVDEVVANGCEMMLQDSQAIRELCEANRTLGEKIGDFLSDFVQSLREAFGGQAAHSPEAQILMQYAEELQRLWDEGFKAAVENRRAGKKNTAYEGGVRYSIARTSKMTLKEQLNEFYSNKMKSSDSFFFGSSTVPMNRVGVNGPMGMTQKAFVKSTKGKHSIPRRVLNRLSENLNTPIFAFYNEDVAAFLIDDIDSEGKPVVVTFDKNGVMDRKNVAEITSIFGLDNPEAWIRNQWAKEKKRFKAFDMKKATAFLQTYSSNATVGEGGDSLNEILSQKQQESKSQNSVSDTVSDRALLLEAAEREGAGASEDLRHFANRMKELESLQRRLERQEKKLEGLREENERAAEGVGPYGKEAAALEGRIAETREAIAKLEERLDQLERGAKLQREVKTLRERWFSQNAAEAVQVQTEIQRENRELREALDFYKQQTKLTPVEQRRVRPQDVARFARALLKEHGSEADLDAVRQKLQAIGDYLVSGDGINGKEYRDACREVARLIADETYVKAEDKQLYRELSERVRSTRLQASADLKGDIPDYNAWRKSQLGRLTLANDGLPIDTFYQELGEIYGEGLFPQDVTAHSDQINRILEVLEQQRPKNVYAYTEGERAFVIRDIANEIMDVMLSGEIRENETMADRNYRRMQEITRQAQEKAREAKNTLEEERAYRKELVQTRTKLIRQELKDSAEARQRRQSIERLRKNLMRKLQENSGKRHVPENLKQALSAWLGTINTLSDFASEERVRDYIDETDRVRQLVARAQDVDYGAELDLPEGLADTLQEHINAAREAMRARGGSVYHMSLEQLRELEDALNAVTHAITQANELLADERHKHELSAVAKSTMAHMDAMNEMKGSKGWRRTAQSFLAWDNATPFYAFKRFGEGGQTVYKEFVRGWSKMAMNARQVLDFAQQLYSADYAKKAEKDIYDFELYRRAGGKTEGGPSRAPSPTDADGNYNSFGDGEIRGDRETVRVTRAQLMSLYGLLKRQQAAGHVLGAGIRVADFKDEKGKNVPQAENYILYEEDVAEMIGKLSAEDKRIVDEMIRYMSTVGSEWGNRVTMKRWGIRAFTEESYFPIRTDSRSRDARTPEGEKASLFRLLNMSFTKSTVRGAKNAIVLDSVFDVFADHMADMAKYEALALPIVDAMKWYNFRVTSGEDQSGRYTTESVQKSMERAYGPEAGKYFINFLQDINGSQEGGRGEGRLKAMMSNYKVAAVGANLRVAIQQPTSIARAALVLDPKYILRGAGMKSGISEALKHSGLAVWKDLGYFDTNINRGIREQIKHEDTWRDKVNDKAMLLAEKGDKMTWGALWNACRIEQAEKLGIRAVEGAGPYKGNERAVEGAGPYSEAYQKLMEATAERFDEVICATQVMDSTVTRSQAMRSTSALMSQLAAFKSEPTLTWNALMDAWMDYRMDARKGEERALHKHIPKMGRTMAVWACCQALTGLAAAIIDACRDDDDYQTWLEKLLEHWGQNLGDNVNILSYLPFVDQLQDVMRGNKQNVMLYEGVDKTVTAARTLKEALWLKLGWQSKPTDLTYNGKMTGWGATYRALQGGSFLVGMPVAGAARDVVAIWNTIFAPLTGKKLKTYDAGPKNEIKYAWQDGWLSDEEAKEYLVKEKVVKSEEEAEKILYQWGLDGEGVYDAVKEAALADDAERFEKALAGMEAGHYSRSDAESAVRSAVKEAYQPDEDGKQRLGKQDAIRLLQSYGGYSAEKAAAEVEKWTCFVVTGIRYDDIDTAFKNGEISESRAIELRQTFGGYSKEAAEKTATLWRWKKEYPQYEDMSESAAGKWYDSIRATGISAEVWADYCTKAKGKNKEDTLPVIQGLPITAEQKDAIYYSEGWAESKIGETPWH